jgi:hypothetical protein
MVGVILVVACGGLRVVVTSTERLTALRNKVLVLNYKEQITLLLLLLFIINIIRGNYKKNAFKFK